MKKQTVFILAVLAILVAVLFINNGTGNSNGVNGDKEIVIGAPTSLTGPAAGDGESIRHGLELAQEDLAKRGVNVKIVHEDDATDQKRAITAVQKLISIDRVDAIIGPTWGFLVEAAVPVLNQNKTVSFSPANTSEFVKGSEYTVFGSVKNEKKVEPVANFLKEKGKKRIGIIVDKSGWGESHIEPFKKAVANAGGEVLLVEEVPFGTEKNIYPTILAKAKSLNIDTLLVTGYEEGLTILIKRTQEQNPGMTLVIAEESPRKLLKRGNISLNDKNEIYLVIIPSSAEFVEKYQAKFGEYPGTYADRAYDGLMLLVEAIEKKGENESVKDYLHNKTNYKGFATTYSFDGKGDIKGGEWVVEGLR